MSGPIMKGAADLCSRVNTPADRRGSLIGGTGSGLGAARAQIRPTLDEVKGEGVEQVALAETPQLEQRAGWE